eukprot:c29285_g1_i1 orf=368-976(+)
MALGEAGRIAMTTASLGILAFIFGVVGENKKPAQGMPIPLGSKTTCHYPSDPSVILGSLSIVLLFFSSVVGIASIFFPYGKKAVPWAALGRSGLLVTFIVLSFILFFTAEGLLMWVTISEASYHVNNVHLGTSDCPTAKTGLMGGAAFLALDTTLFWLVCQMLTMNAREDYLLFDQDEKGSYGEVVTADYTSAGAVHSSAVA